MERVENKNGELIATVGSGGVLNIIEGKGDEVAYHFWEILQGNTKAIEGITAQNRYYAEVAKQSISLSNLLKDRL